MTKPETPPKTQQSQRIPTPKFGYAASELGGEIHLLFWPV